MSFNIACLKRFTDSVYDEIKAAILRGEFLPGQRLNERDMISRVGTSRTPIREAIIKLEKEGLIERFSSKGGYFVTAIGRQHIDDIFGIRKILENYCILLTINQISNDGIRQLEQVVQEEEKPANKDIFTLIELDTKFHDIIYKASGNRKLFEIMNNLKDHLCRYRALSFRFRERKQVMLLNHRELLTAIKNKDKKLAKKLTNDTLSRSKSILLQELKQITPATNVLFRKQIDKIV